MRLSFFSRAASNAVIPADLSWNALCTELLRGHEFSGATREEHRARLAYGGWPDHELDKRAEAAEDADKIWIPAFSPAEYPPGFPRRLEHVVAVHFGVLDLDGLPTATVCELVDAFTAIGIAFLLYTTWGHYAAAREGKTKARLLFPFSRPVTPREWPDVWLRINAMVGGVNDPRTKDAGRIYFLPSAPRGTEGSAVMECRPGTPIDVDRLSATPLPLEAIYVRPLSVVEMQAWIAQLSKARTPAKLWLYEACRKLLTGDAFAESGGRDDAIFRMVCAIVEKFPDASAESIRDLFAPSISIMSRQSADCPTLQDVESKIRRHQAQIQEARETQKNEAIEEHKKNTFAAFEYSGREHPYTPEELEFFAGKQGVLPRDFMALWVIQKDQSFYFYVMGRYKGPFGINEVRRAAQTYLAPASSAGIELMKVSKDGTLVYKDLDQIMREYGTIASSIYVDATAQEARFEHRTGAMVEAPSPQRSLQAEHSPAVDRWLRHLGGEEAEALLDWISVATRLEEPCAALYLDGVKDAGKSLLAMGLSRIWTTNGPPSLSDAMGAWNSMVTTCPLVFGDEFVPKDYRGGSRTGELRQFIQARSRTLKRKYVADATHKGCTRLILAANNTDLLVTGETLTANDIEAIVDRVLHIEVKQPAMDYLQSLPREVVQSFVEGDVIARHALWLRDTRQVARQHRFLVKGKKAALHRALTTGGGLRSAVCNWLVAYLLDRQRFDRNGSGLVRVHAGRLLVVSKALAERWSTYETNVQAPPTGALAKALAGLSFVARVTLRAGDRVNTNYRRIDTENLVAWAEENGYADRASIVAALAIPTPGAAEEI